MKTKTDLRYEIEELKHQLAEKDKEIAKKEMLIDYGKQEIKSLHKKIDEIVDRDEKICLKKDKEIALLENALDIAIEIANLKSNHLWSKEEILYKAEKGETK